MSEGFKLKACSEGRPKPAPAASAASAPIDTSSSKPMSPNNQDTSHTSLPVNSKQPDRFNPFPATSIEKAVIPKRRVEWDEAEVDAVAKEFVARRRDNPFESPVALSNRAQERALPEHRRRKLITVPANLRTRIMHHWRTALAKDDEEHPPFVLRVEVPKPFDYTEALANFDSPTLAALLVGKLSKELGTVLSRLAARPEAVDSRHSVVPVRAPQVPTVFAKPEKRRPRVAIIGPLPSQMTDIERQVKEAGLAVELRFVDKEASSTNLPTSCDFAILTRYTRHKWWDSARQKLGNDYVYFVDGGISQVVQKVRDICSRQ